MKTEIVRDIKTLKELKKAGLIKFHEQTGTKITSLYGSKKFTCYYIDGRAENVTYYFENKGFKYFVDFVSGCFMPYVFKVIE